MSNKNSIYIPTSCGMILFDHVCAMVKIEKQAIDRIEEQKNQKEHSLLVGTGHVFWEICLKNALAEYRSAHPQGSIHVEFGNNLYLLDRTLSGHLDILFGHEILGLSHKSGMIFNHIFRFRACMVCS